MPLFGTDGNGFFLTKRSFVIFFHFFSYIIEYLIIILRNCWIHYNAYKRTEMPSFMTLLHFRTCHNFWNLETSAKFQNLIFFIDFSSNAGSSKIVHLSNSDIAWHSRYLRLHGVCITDRRSPIACQTRRSFSTILLEYLHGCLSPLAWALQYLHCPWIHLSTWIEFRSHLPVFGRAVPQAVHLAVARSLKMCNFILHQVSPFWKIIHFMTRHFGIDETLHFWKFTPRFCWSAYLNGLPLRWALFQFHWPHGGLVLHGTFLEFGRQNNLNDYNEQNTFSVVTKQWIATSQQDSREEHTLALSYLAWVWISTQI